jgi:hypothetical protein
MLPRSLWTLILAVAAAPRMTLTGLSPSANRRRGINQTAAVAIAAEAKKRLRESGRARLIFIAMPMSALNKCEQVGIDDVGLRRDHAVRQIFVCLECAVFEELG